MTENPLNNWGFRPMRSTEPSYGTEIDTYMVCPQLGERTASY